VTAEQVRESLGPGAVSEAIVGGAESPTGEGMPRGTVVVSGSASAEEVAAIVGVLSLLGGDEGGSATTQSASGWLDHGRQVRVGLAPGRGAWRASSFPH